MASPERDLPYRMDGEFVELCDCTTVCPCWLDRPPTENRCTGAFAWAVDSGEIQGTDVSGRRIVSVSFHSGHRDTGGQEVFLFVDEDAPDDQYDLLALTFSGRGGGPLGELGTLMGTLRGTERAAIDVSSTGRFVSLTVDQRIRGDAQVLLGADGGVTQLSHGRLSSVLGATAEVGTSSAFRVDLGAVGFGIDVRGRAAMRGRFSYRNEGAPA
jgi:hypothetical protein